MRLSDDGWLRKQGGKIASLTSGTQFLVTIELLADIPYFMELSGDISSHEIHWTTAESIATALNPSWLPDKEFEVGNELFKYLYKCAPDKQQFCLTSTSVRRLIGR